MNRVITRIDVYVNVGAALIAKRRLKCRQRRPLKVAIQQFVLVPMIVSTCIVVISVFLAICLIRERIALHERGAVRSSRGE